MRVEPTLKPRIGFKLFILLTVLIVLAIAPLTYVVFSTVSYFGNYTVSVNRKQIKDQAHSYLQTIAKEQARKYEAVFSRAAVASSLMAAQAKAIYDNQELYWDRPTAELLFRRLETNGMYATSIDSEVPSLYWGGESITSEVAREIQALTQLDPVMKRAKADVPESHAAHMITVSGIGRYLTYKKESAKSLYDLPPVSEFDLRDGEPLTIFSSEAQPEQETRWTRVYKDDVISGLMMTASSAVVDNSGKLRAITGIDVPLNNIVLDLLRVNSSTSNSGVLFSFLFDQTGRIIAFPQQYLELFGIDINWGKFRYSSDILEYNIADSSRQEISEALPKLLGAVADTIEIELDSEKYLFTMHTMHSLGWHLVLVNRETQLISSVARTEEALTGTMHLLGQKFIANVLLILFFAIVAVFFAVRYFVSPLRKLSEAALRVGGGNLKTRCYLDRNDELGSLADSFNNMVRRLETAEKRQTRHAKQLELAVQDQTRDLREKNFELEDIIYELNAESERRKRAVEALEKNEEQLKESKQQLQDSLGEKEVLMREIYHRTKNNMLVIISMLNLQAFEIEDAGVRELFQETENRIRAMSLAHEKLYQSQNLSEVDLVVYLRDMVRSLVDTMVLGNRIRVEVEGDNEVVVSLDNIVPLGLAVNEIVTNSIKHAFPDNGPGTVFVQLLRQDDGVLEVRIGDNGIGLPEEIDPHRIHSLGLQITVSLIERQLQGKLELNRDGGTMFIIQFKEMARPKRI